MVSSRDPKSKVVGVLQLGNKKVNLNHMDCVLAIVYLHSVVRLKNITQLVTWNNRNKSKCIRNTYTACLYIICDSLFCVVFVCLCFRYFVQLALFGFLVIHLQETERWEATPQSEQIIFPQLVHAIILLMEGILHHPGCIKPWKNGINYLSTGAGFLPSTVSQNLMFRSFLGRLK